MAFDRLSPSRSSKRAELVSPSRNRNCCLLTFGRGCGQGPAHALASPVMAQPPAQSLGTRILDQGDTTPSLVLRSSRLSIEKGPDAGKLVPLERLSLRVGTAADNDLVLSDETVSAYHFELAATEHGIVLRDLGSTNGTFVDGHRTGQVYLSQNARIKVGETLLRFAVLREDVSIPLSRSTNFGQLLGHSAAMRAAFAVLEGAAKADATVLITGESGTGKELAAQALHERSGRRDGPFIVLDCGAASQSLIESQLFGHARGAFTGALESRAGVFEAANSGTLVLDEIGELSLELQPKLLRAVESRTIQRLGETKPRSVDVRFIAATNRNLEEEVRAGRFRQDLLYRLSVIAVRLPSLRERKEELPRLVRHFLSTMTTAGGSPPELSPQVMQLLLSHDWPGNVRELRNFAERFLALPGADPAMLLPTASAEEAADPDRPFLASVTKLPFHEAKRRWTDHFEKAYLMELFESQKGNISAVARAAGLSRQSCYRLMLKHGLRVE